MTGQTVSPNNFQQPHELTPRDDNKKIASEILKRADQLIRKGDLDIARREILKAKNIDPRNVYALALEERINFLKTEIDSLKNKEKTTEQTLINNAHEKTGSGENHAIPDDNKTLPTVPSPQAHSETTSISIPVSENVVQAINNNEPQQDNVVNRSIELESYRKTLAEAWNDGSLTGEEERQLNELRTLFEITDAEHQAMEKNVKHECYRNAIIRQLSNNPITLSDAKSIADLRNMFNISEEEHSQIQVQLMTFIQQKHRNKILVIDDDTRLLELLASSLEDNGFDVTALPTSDEAYALLRKFVPDLILCDINLETSTMGGFTFYEKVQELKNVQSVPFVFLTGLTDEALIRTGKELGVDDYLMKPISEQTLVSTLRGKLKRFKQLKNISTQPTTTLL